ncbi:TPA: phage tail protein [Escherichia coli]|nr:phage tail protein [Escherichia coli]HCO8804094.1 phage tail protein [Escherichia coli]
MTVKYYAILTNQGAARLANATMLGSKLNLTQMAVGDANGVLPTPDPAQTKLINQKRIAPLNLLSVDPNNQSQIIAEQIIPENEGGFWIREIGLYDDEGVLIAVANCPETYKPQLQEGSGRTQTIRMILVVSNTEAITLKIDPSVVLATRKYVDDEVLELRLYVDEQMRNHIAAQDPHTQYAQKHNPTFTGEPKAPTPAAGNNTTRIATTAFVQAAITALINGAPDTLDTLKEIAAAINNDPKFSATINNALSGKQPLDETLTHLSGKDVAGLLAYLDLGESTFGAQNCVVFDKAGVSTWNVPDIVKKGRRVRVRVVGGGGSGGYPAINTTNPSGGGGGGGGGVSESVIDLTGISTVTITVGSGGTGQNTSASNGRPGGTSSFGSYLSATGGDGGGQVSGGAGGEGMGGQINTSLGPGSPGASTIATGNSAVGGSGGGPGGNGQVLGSAENVAKGAKGPGGGGAGLATKTAGGVTGAGYSGIVVIYW